MKCACRYRYLHPPGNKHEESVISVAALPVDAGQLRGGQGGGLAPEQEVAEAREEEEEEVEDDLDAGEKDENDEDEPAGQEDFLIHNVLRQDADSCTQSVLVKVAWEM